MVWQNPKSEVDPQIPKIPGIGKNPKQWDWERWLTGYILGLHDLCCVLFDSIHPVGETAKERNVQLFLSMA